MQKRGRLEKPLIKWSEYTKQKPTKEEVIKWWRQYPKANIGIVTGQISGLVVVDLDDQEAQEWAKQQGLFDLGAPCVKTARGLHLYYRYPKTVGFKQLAGFRIRKSI